MKVWIRTRIEGTRCGCCGGEIPVGAPQLVIVDWRLRRCAVCAGEPAPQDVAALPDTAPTHATLARRRQLSRASAPRTLDGKQRQLGGDQ